MCRKTLVISILVAILAIAVTGCKKDNPNSNNPSGNMENVVLKGVVKDTDGNPLSGVKVKTGAVSTTTDNNGEFSFSKAGVVEKRAVIKFEKNGYFPLTRSGIKQNEMFIEATLSPKGNSKISLQDKFKSSEAKDLKIGGMKVALSASAVTRADGSAYSGNVNADMLYLDPNDENFAGLMPGGDLAAQRADGSNAVLISYGMTNVSLTDDSGNPLQLKSGTPAEVTFPIPAGMENNAPATMPLWSFDEEKGVWKEEGVATLKNGVYVGTAHHFSWVNCDYPEEIVNIKGKVLDCKDKPVANIKVYSGQTSISTNSSGEYTGAIPANTPTVLSVTIFDNSYSINLPGYPANTTQTVPNIKVPCGVTIKGKVLCKKNNTPAAYEKVTAGSKSTTTNINGEYLFLIPENTPVTVTAKTDSENVPGQQEGTVYTVRDLIVDCEAGEPATYTKTEKGAVRYRSGDDEEGVNFLVISFDNNGYRFRWDYLSEEDETESFFTYIINHFNKTLLFGVAGTWMEQTYSDDYTKGDVFSIDEASLAAYLQPQPVNIAGKSCKVYQMNSSGTEIVIATWNGIIMLLESNGKVLYRALAATLIVPEVAFTQTFNVTWI